MKQITTILLQGLHITAAILLWLGYGPSLPICTGGTTEAVLKHACQPSAHRDSSALAMRLQQSFMAATTLCLGCSLTTWPSCCALESGECNSNSSSRCVSSTLSAWPRLGLCCTDHAYNQLATIWLAAGHFNTSNPAGAKQELVAGLTHPFGGSGRRGA